MTDRAVIFSTNKVEKIAHISFNTAITSNKEIINQIDIKPWGDLLEQGDIV